MNKLAKIFTNTASTVLVVALSAFCICVGMIVALASAISPANPPDRKKEIESPNGKFSAIAVTHDGGTSSDTVDIAIKSNANGQEIGIGYLTGAYNLRIDWLNKNTLSIKYHSARAAQFGARSLDWDKEIIKVEVVPDAEEGK